MSAAAVPPPEPPLLEMRGVSKSFPGVQALSDVDFASCIAGGTEVHGAYGGKTDLLIEGTLHGDVEVEGTVMLSPEAIINGHLTGVDVVVSGRVTGDVRARRAAEIRPQAIVQGSVIAREVYIAIGAKIGGEIIAHGKRGVTEFRERRRGEGKLTPESK